MPFRRIIDSLPGLYHGMLPGIFDMKIPPEPFSDCFNCPMTAGSREELDKDSSRPFAPDTKCCTFIPRLPNYMAGAILSDTDPGLAEGKRRIIERIRSREGIIPNGIYPTNKYNSLYQAKSPEEFGRNRELLCPYFCSGKYNCTIWKYREAICALWFCKHLATIRGREFWNAVIEYMKFIQQSLINVSAYLCGLQAVDLYGEGGYPEYIVPDNLEDADKVYAQVWKEWNGNETGYYIRCYEIVTRMEQEYMQKILQKGEPLAKKIKVIALDVNSLPAYLSLEKRAVRDNHDGSYQVEVISYLETLKRQVAWSLRLPKYVLDAFDGITKTSEIMEQIRKKQQVKVEPEILIALYRNGILSERKI